MGVPTAEAQAIALFQAGRFAEAEAAFRTILARDPANRDALLALGIIAARSQRRDEAWTSWAAPLQPIPAPTRLSFTSAACCANRDAISPRRRPFGGPLRSTCAHPKRMSASATRCARPAIRVGARASFGAALAIDPAFASAHYNLALLEIDEGNLAAAESSLARVLEREPGNVAALNNLGIVLRKSATPERARACFERAVEADPRAADALNNLASSCSARSASTRPSRSMRARWRRAGLSQAYTNWGNALKDRGDLAGALVRYQHALAADPRDPNALVNSGSIALERGERSQARRFYERALDARPDLADARYSLGLIDLLEHDFEHGWDGYEHRFATDPPVAAIGPPRLPRLPPPASRARAGSRFEPSRAWATRSSSPRCFPSCKKGTPTPWSSSTSVSSPFIEGAFHRSSSPHPRTRPWRWPGAITKSPWARSPRCFAEAAGASTRSPARFSPPIPLASRRCVRRSARVRRSRSPGAASRRRAGATSASASPFRWSASRRSPARAFAWWTFNTARSRANATPSIAPIPDCASRSRGSTCATTSKGFSRPSPPAMRSSPRATSRRISPAPSASAPGWCTGGEPAIPLLGSAR
jgi:tetratricopeptide (TPR) repeat protein